jgi:hypothetical protein
MGRRPRNYRGFTHIRIAIGDHYELFQLDKDLLVNRVESAKRAASLHALAQEFLGRTGQLGTPASFAPPAPPPNPPPPLTEEDQYPFDANRLTDPLDDGPDEPLFPNSSMFQGFMANWSESSFDP